MKRALLVTLLLAMCVLAGLGALVGMLFGKVLIGAAIGAAIPPVWAVLAFCFMKIAFGLLNLLKWG